MLYVLHNSIQVIQHCQEWRVPDSIMRRKKSFMEIVFKSNKYAYEKKNTQFKVTLKSILWSKIKISSLARKMVFEEKESMETIKKPL